MSSMICANCRLEVSPGEEWCRHCGARLRAAANQQDYPIPAYGLPPSVSGLPVPGSGFGPEAGVWRDGKTLIMHKTARLPDRCIKCGVDANGS